MSVSLACTCGARFEVEDTYAGQAVECPECQGSVLAPRIGQAVQRTSGLAIASVLLALIGAFTVLFTLIAVFVGGCALVSIARHRDRLAGKGYAIFGIVAGLVFTGLSLFLYSNLELLPIDGFMEGGMLSSQIEYPAELEISRPTKHFAVTRPNKKWGVARQSLIRQLGSESDLLLANAYQHTYVEVFELQLGGQSVDAFMDAVVKSYEEDEAPARRHGFGSFHGDVKLRHRQTLPPRDGLRATEVLLDARVDGMNLTYLDRVVVADGQDRAFRVRGWSPRRRYPIMEPEIRRAIDSLRALP